jgi:predicted Na+-dependent transporter
MWVLTAIVAGTLVAVLYPSVVLIAKPGLQPAFAVTMLLVGTLVRREQVRAFVKAPTRPLVGTVVQYTIMPLVAAGVSWCFDDPLVRTGIGVKSGRRSSLRGSSE